MIRFVVPSLMALSALPAFAQDASNGLSFSGEAKLEYVDADSSIWAFHGDAALSWRSGGVLGADAAIETLYLDDGTDFTNVWAALVLSTGAGEFAVGAPRPVTETLGVMPRFSSSRVVDFDASALLGTLASTTSFVDKGMTPGITYRRDSGNLTFGAGYHHMNDENVDLVEGIMRYDAGATSFFVSGEFATAPSDDAMLLQIGAFHDAERFDAGISLSKLDAGETAHSLRLYGAVNVMTALTLRGDALLIEDDSDLYSVSATYAMPSGLFVEGGATFDDSDEVVDVGLGYKF